MSDQKSGVLIFGAEAMALRLFGSSALKRRVYHLSNAGELPTFRMGSTLCTTEALLNEFIRSREDAALEAATQRRRTKAA